MDNMAGHKDTQAVKVAGPINEYKCHRVVSCESDTQRPGEGKMFIKNGLEGHRIIQGVVIATSQTVATLSHLQMR